MNRTRAVRWRPTIDGVVYARQPVRTHLVTASDDAADVLLRHARPLPDDTALVAVSERMVAITQGRSHRMVDIKPGPLARFLVRFVTRPGYGIGLGTAETMQLAIDEVGAPRILLAAGVSAVSKPFGVHGLFYRVAGPQAAAIDGPTSYTIPPYNQSATLGPKDPDGAARRLGRGDRPAGGRDRCQRCRLQRARRQPRHRPLTGEAPVRRQPPGSGARADADRGGAPRRVARGPALPPEPKRRLTPP